MPKQLEINFDIANKTVPKKAKRRTNTQCGKILARLRQGPATNAELATMALNYRARVSELRQAGCVIDVETDDVTGLGTYTLSSERLDVD